MPRIMAAIQRMLAALQTVWKPVWHAGRWTMEAVQVVAAPVMKLADIAINGVVAVHDSIRAVLKCSPAQPGADQQATEAAQQAEEQVRAVQAQNEAALTVQQTARLLQRVAKWGAEGRDYADLADALPKNLQA